MNCNQQIVAAVIASLICGCGTIGNRVSIAHFDPKVESPAGGYAYGGVRFDAKVAALAFSKAREISASARLLSSLYIIDVPVSAVFDTLLLPITIPEEQQRSADRNPSRVPDGPSESN